MRFICSIILIFAASSCAQFNYKDSIDFKSPALSGSFKQEIDFSKLISTKSCIKQESNETYGSATISDALRKSNIKTIVFVERRKEQLFLANKTCTVVKGYVK